MQRWMKADDWPLTVPTYDPWRRTCVCHGYETNDPLMLKPTDEVLVWIAPGDLVSLSDEQKIQPLPASFASAHRNHYAKEEHVKVCLQQKLVVDLWNIANDTADSGRHCHVQSSTHPSNVEQFYLGWDGALFCSTPQCDWNGVCESSSRNGCSCTGGQICFSNPKKQKFYCTSCSECNYVAPPSAIDNEGLKSVHWYDCSLSSSDSICTSNGQYCFADTNGDDCTAH